MDIDNKLKKQYGKKQPFKMPEGYLEQLHDTLMQSLPETSPQPTLDTKVTLMARIKPWLYMAAMFAGIIFMVQGIMFVQDVHFKANDIAAAEDVYTEEIDHFMSSSLYNEYVLYSYLTTTDYE